MIFFTENFAYNGITKQLSKMFFVRSFVRPSTEDDDHDITSYVS